MSDPEAPDSPDVPDVGGPDVGGPDDAERGVARDVRESTPNSTGPHRASGGMGVSSEWVGHTGPGQVATDGVKNVAPVPAPDDAPPEQSPGNAEPHPHGLPPKAPPPSVAPRTDQP